MSLVDLREVKAESGAVSGGAMDRVVERKRIDKRILIAGGALAVLLLVLFFWMFAPRYWVISREAAPQLMQTECFPADWDMPRSLH